MAAQDGLTFEGTFNNSSTGLFKTNTSQAIGSDDQRALVTAIKESYLNRIDDVKDEDDMASNSAAAVPTQQSVKAYVDAQVAGGTSIPFGTTSGTNTYTITATPTVTAYADGDLYLIEIGTSSTNASTLNFDGVGAKKAYERPNKQITAGDWETGRHYLVVYDSALDGGAGGFAVVGDLNHERLTYRGGYDVSSNLFPSTGGSGPSGGLRTGDFWGGVNTGTLGSTAVSNRDLIINVGGSSPGQTEGNWILTSGVASVDTKLALKQTLINSAVALVDGASIDLTAIKHTLATALGRTFTISYTGDDITMEVTLSATTATQTFPAGSLCVSEGVASGDNTCPMAGVSGDKYMFAIKKIGSVYYVVCKNFGQ